MAEKKKDEQEKVEPADVVRHGVGQVGTVREVPEDRKPDPTTIAFEQVLDGE